MRCLLESDYPVTLLQVPLPYSWVEVGWLVNISGNSCEGYWPIQPSKLGTLAQCYATQGALCYNTTARKSRGKPSGLHSTQSPIGKSGAKDDRKDGRVTVI